MEKLNKFDTYWEFMSALKKRLKGQDYSIDYYFNVEDYYWIEEEDGLILLTIMCKHKHNREEKAQVTFNSVIKAMQGLLLPLPTTSTLPYKDALRWLYNFYPYSADDKSNCVLLWDCDTILAISDNWCKETRTISSTLISEPSYIVYRGEDGEYKKIERTKKNTKWKKKIWLLHFS